METTDYVLLALAIVGGAVALLGLALDVRWHGQEKWEKQQSEGRVDLANLFGGTVGQDPAEVEKLEQQKARHLLETGRPLGAAEPEKARSQLLKAERGLPFWMTVGGIVLSTLSGIISAITSGSPQS